MFYDSLYIRRRLEWSRSSLDLVNTLIHRRLPYFLSPFKDPSVTLTRVALSETTNTLQKVELPTRYRDYLLRPNETGHFHRFTHRYLRRRTRRPLQGYSSSTRRTSRVSPLRTVLFHTPQFAPQDNPHSRRT